MRALRTIVLSIVAAGALLTCAGRQSGSAEIPDVQADSGPFLVAAKTFRGTEAEDKARALASELKDRYGLTTHLLRNTRPQREAKEPLQVAVVVGDAKTMAEARKLRESIRKSTVGSALKPVVMFNPLAVPQK